MRLHIERMKTDRGPSLKFNLLVRVTPSCLANHPDRHSEGPFGQGACLTPPTTPILPGETRVVFSAKCRARPKDSPDGTNGYPNPLPLKRHEARFGAGASEAVRAEKASSEALEAGNERWLFIDGLFSRQSFLSDS